MRTAVKPEEAGKYCSRDYLKRLREVWMKTKKEEEKQAYLSAVKKCNEKLLIEGEI